MKLTTFLILFSLIQVSAATFGQQVTIHERSATLKSVLKQISEQSGYGIIYDANAIADQQKIQIAVDRVPVAQAMNSALNGLSLAFEINGNVITIRKAPESSLLDRLKAAFAAIDVTGQVVDENGKPIPGVTVKTKDSKRGTTTAADGRFLLKHVDENAILVLSFIGYQLLEVPVKPDLGILKLAVSTSGLDEVQVIAYGKTTPRMSTGNISTVSAKDIDKSPVSNILQAIQGRIPGLQVATTTGFNNGGVKFRVQGQNSMTRGNNPYIVVDGVPYPEMLQNNLVDGLTLGSSSLNYLNTNDIESVTVLKDADATAIYGSRAANGAILITTKKGRSGEVQVDVSAQQGISKAARSLDLMNTSQYLQMRAEALKNDGAVVKPSDYDINGFWDTTRSTNWQKELIGQTASFTNLNTTISGGANNVTYLVGASFNRQTTILPGDFDDKRTGVHFNIGSSSANQRFKMQFNGSFLNDINRLPGADLTATALKLAPDAPALYNTDGTLNWAQNSDGISTWSNPLASLLNAMKDHTQSLLGNALLSYELTKGLQLKTTLGYNSLVSDQVSIGPLEAAPPESRADMGGATAAYMNNRAVSWIIEPQLTYQDHYTFGNVNYLLGATIQQRNSSSRSFYGQGYPTSASLWDSNMATTLTNLDRTLPELYKYAALFANINYDYQGKYLLNLTARRDGSSHFGANNKYHTFGAAGLGWVFTEEAFLKHKTFLSFGKLKASYGTTGSDQIGNYAYLTLFQNTGAVLPYNNYNSIGFFSYSDVLANPYLKWEETKKLNVGVDLGLWKDRILFGLNFYRNRTSNQLLRVSLPLITGSDHINMNLPATVQNQGLELSVASTHIQRESFRWTSNFNLTIPRNKLWRFEGLETNDYFKNSYILNQPLSVTRVYHYLGVNPETGVYQVADAQGNATTTPDPDKDRTVLVNMDHRYYGALENSLSFKNLELSFLFYFVKQTGYTNFAYANPGRVNFNAPTALLDRWQKPGDVTEYQRYNSNNSLAAARSLIPSSDKGIGDASYIRLKNVTLSYHLPKTVRNAVHSSDFRIYLQAQNWLTITKYPGLDPETMLNNLPPLRTLTLGIQILF